MTTKQAGKKITQERWRKQAWWLLLTLLAVKVFFSPCSSAAQVTLDGSLGPKGPLDGPNYKVPAELGQQRGPNLFHSFTTFNVPSEGSVTFTGPVSVDNIIGRITGGTASHIDGLLSSTIPGANLFLLNPSGVLFGPNAQLDVQGSFYVSTADYLRLADGTRFAAHLSVPTVLSIAPPAAFGFLGPQPQAISIDGSDLQGKFGTTLSLSGGDIEINAARLQVPGGHIHLESMAANGEVSLPPAVSQTTPTELSGSLTIRDSLLDVRGSQDGRISIRSGQLVLDAAAVTAETGNGTQEDAGSVTISAGQMLLDNGAFISTGTTGDGHGGSIFISAGRLQLDGDAVIAAASVSKGDAGQIILQVGKLILTGGAQIDVGTSETGSGGLLQVNATEEIRIGAADTQVTGLFSNSFGAGDAGTIHLETPFLSVQGGLVQSITHDGVGGTIEITAQRVLLTAGGQIDTRTDGMGDGGMLHIQATEELALVGHNDRNEPSALVSQTLGDGAAGAMVLEVGRLSLRDGAQLLGNTGPESSGNGGIISITATKDITIEGRSALGNRSGIFSNASGSGAAGDIFITTPTLLLRDGIIQAATGTAGQDAGFIAIEAQRVALTQGGQISSSTEGAGAGGLISISASESLEVTGRSADGPDGQVSAIFTNTSGSGDSGLILLKAPTVLVDDGVIQALTTGAGNAGIIILEGERITLSGGAQIDNRTEGTGEGGVILVTATDTLLITGRDKEGHPSALSSTTAYTGEQAGAAGVVFATAPQIILTEGGEITSSSFGSGAGGVLAISAADTIAITGEGSGLFSTAAGSGDAGAIFLAAPHIRLADYAQVQTSTSGAGNAGVIALGAFRFDGEGFAFTGSAIDELTLTGGARITSNVLPGSTGAGGGILLSGKTITLNTQASIEATTAGAADAGDIVIGDFAIADEGFLLRGQQGRQLVVADGASISTSTLPGSAGAGGLLILFADEVRLERGGRIEAATAGTGAAGIIVLGDLAEARVLLTEPGDSAETLDFPNGTITTLSLTDGAQIASSSLLQDPQAGIAGDIHIRATDTLTLHDSAVTTAASQSAGGNIDAQARLVFLVNSRMTAEAQGMNRLGSNGGNVAIAGDFVVLNNSLVLANAFGGDGGNITITAAKAFLASADSNIDASSRLGVQGEVAIQSPATEVSGVLAPLSQSFASAETLLRERCVPRFRHDNFSSFVVRGREGIPEGPEDLLLSPMTYPGRYPQPTMSLSPARERYAQEFPSALLGWDCRR